MATTRTKKPAAPRTRRPRDPERDATLPTWVVDLDTFLEWGATPGFPEVGRVSFIDGQVVFDMSEEELFSHGLVKTLFAHVLFGLAQAARIGNYWCDGAYIVNHAADMSNKPDGVFVSGGSVRSGLVRYRKGRRRGLMAIDGSPDMVLEVVSASSVHKDKVRLFELYALAGILEYWIVDVRDGRLEFAIHRLGASRYEPVRAVGGWLKSAVFGKSFKLTEEPAEGDDGRQFRLDVK